MEALLKLLGVRRRNQEWLTFVLILILFVLAFVLLRGCIGGERVSRNALVVDQPVLPNGALVEQEVPFRGSFEPREGVEILLNGESIGRVRTQQNGQWRFSTVIDQPGKYSLQAVGVNSDGDEVKSSRYPFEVYPDREFVAFGSVNNMHNVIDDGSGSGNLSAEEARFGSGVPQIDTDLNGMTIEPGRFFLTGRATPGSTVLITNNGASLGTVKAGASGRWRTNVNLINDGSYLFEASNAEVVGLGTTTANVSVVTPTPPPTIGIVRDNDLSTVNLRGRGEPGSMLVIYHNGDEVGSAEVSEFGTWSLTDIALATGDSSNTFSASVVDENGDILATSLPATLNVTRVDEGSSDDGGSSDGGGAASSVGAPTLQAAVSNGLAVLSGTGKPNTTLTIRRDGEPIGTADVDADGNWTLTNVEVLPGENVFVAAGEPEEGATLLSAPLTIDGGDANADGGEIVVPTVAAEVDGDAINLSGTAAPNTTVTIVQNGETVGTAEVDADGNWSLDGIEPGPGVNQFFVEAEPSGDAIAVSEPATIDWSIVSAGPIVEPTVEAEVDGDAINLSGTAAPNTTVTIVQNGETVGTAEVDADGNWSLDGIEPGPGVNQFFVEAEPSGDAIAVSEPAIIDWSIASAGPIVVPTVEATVDGGVANLVGTGAPNTTVRIMRNGEEAGTADVDADGNWSLDGIELADGENTFIVEAEPAGDAIAISDPVVVDGGAASGEATEGAAGEGDSAGEIGIDVPSYDPDAVALNADGVPVGTVAFSGVGSPVGAKVVVFYDGVAVGETTVGEDGTWSYSAELPLNAGDHEAYISVEDDDGNTVESDVATMAGTEQTGALTVAFALGTAPSESTEDGDGEGGEDGDTAGSEAGVASGIASLPTVELILDASWSMTFPLDSDQEADRLTASDPASRFGIARNVLIDIVENSLVEGQPMGLRVFGNLQGDLLCQTNNMIPVSPLDKEATVELLRRTAPQFNANTAIAASLAGAAEDLAGVEGEKTIVLLTDGQETCEGDVAAEIEKLRDAGIDVTIDVVGFAILDDDLRAEFESWAELGGGTYYDARDAAALEEALTTTLQASYVVNDAAGEEVARGAVGGSPIDLPIGFYTVVVNGRSYDVVVGSDGAEVLVE